MVHNSVIGEFGRMNDPNLSSDGTGRSSLHYAAAAGLPGMTQYVIERLKGLSGGSISGLSEKTSLVSGDDFPNMEKIKNEKDDNIGVSPN